MIEQRLFKKPLVIGLGITGLSCVRYLCQQDYAVAVTDSRPTPPMLLKLQEEFPEVVVETGGYNQKLLATADCLVVSPGVDLTHPSIACRIRQGIPVLGDIELFVRQAAAPLVVVTGSNGKTTAVTLIGKMIAACGLCVEVIGNVGPPALDALSRPVPDYYVLELSSFQLATTHSLKSEVAVVLNVTPDHLDRHIDMQAYLFAKQRIYKDAKIALVNKDQDFIWKDLELAAELIDFSVLTDACFSIKEVAGHYYIMHADNPVMLTSDLFLQGRHHMQNALVALAVGVCLNLNKDKICNVISKFRGLPHRCEHVATLDGVNWYNDSKGTNVGATIAAIESLGEKAVGRIILIAGGEDKGADFSSWREVAQQYLQDMIVLGVAADKMSACLSDVVTVVHVDDMRQAVTRASFLAKPGDTVLLSPGCASFDMFRNYAHRGDVFCQCVNELMI